MQLRLGGWDGDGTKPGTKPESNKTKFRFGGGIKALKDTVPYGVRY